MTKQFEDITNTFKQAEDHADVMFVSTFDAIFIIGEVDFLVLLTALTKHLGNIYSCRAGRVKTPERLYSAELETKGNS